MLSRTRCVRGGSAVDFRTTPKLADAFQHVLLRNRWAFDHVAVDVGYLCGIAGRFTRDLIGSERDAEAAKVVQKQLHNQVLRRVGANKSLALVLDGSEPLWKVQSMRRHPGKHFGEKFYRSAASPMVYGLEDRLRALGLDIRPSPPLEFLVSGAGVPGPAEGKLTSWMLDLATRAVHTATSPPAAPPVARTDSLCVVGHTDLILNVLGATPFDNITAVTFNAGEVKSLSLADCVEWLGLNAYVADGPGTSASASPSASTPHQRLAAVRTDVILLYLMANGMTSSGLASFGIAFSDLMEGYLAELPHTGAVGTRDAAGEPSGVASKYFCGILFDEYPLGVSGAARSSVTASLPSLRLKPDVLARVLVRAAKRPIAFPARHCANSANYLEILLQSHAMFASGSVQNLGWVPPDYGANVPEKPPKVPLDQFVGHLRSAAAYVCPSRSRAFALTGLESLLLTAPEPAIIDQVVPMYARGHAMPEGVANDIVETKDVEEAFRKTQAVLSGLVNSARPLHPALAHCPTHYIARAMGAAGPPAGWCYHSINLGLKAEAMNLRYALNAADADALQALSQRQVDRGGAPTSTADATAAGAGLSKRNHLYVYDAAAGGWNAVPCAGAEADGECLSTLRVVSWNVQFDRHSGERTPRGRDGIQWCTRTRYLALAKALESTDADVIAMQEVESAWCAHLMAQPWVQHSYALSCLATSHAIDPWGVMLLVKRQLRATAFDHANVPAFSGHTSAMPEVTIQLGPNTAPVTIGSMHLLAPYSQNNVNNRETQLANLVKYLQQQNSSSSSSSNSSHARIVMGDFNDYPLKFFRFPGTLAFKDAWESTHPRCNELPLPPPGAAKEEAETAEERGYTIDGHANPYAARIIEPEFYGRPDRVMYAARQLQPVHVERVGTQSVLSLMQSEELTHLVERPQERIPDYLFPSDHFGVLVEFQVL